MDDTADLQEEPMEGVDEDEERLEPGDSIQAVIPVLRKMAELFVPRAQDDMAFVEKTRDIIMKMDIRRDAELKRLEEEHIQRSKLLKKLRSDAKRPAGVPSAAEHAQKMEKLEKEKFDLVKEISETEARIGHSAGQLSKLREELATLQARDIAHETVVGGAVLRLQLLKKLGFDLTPSGKVLVHSKTNAHVVSLDDGKSQFEKTNELWDLASDVHR